MNDQDTADIVRRIVGTWPMSPKGPLWTEAIGDLDYGPALATFIQLRDETDETRISIARFKLTYRGLASHGNTSREPPAEPGPPPISFDEYVTRMTWQAGTGDAAAAEALDEWSRASVVIARMGGRL